MAPGRTSAHIDELDNTLTVFFGGKRNAAEDFFNLGAFVGGMARACSDHWSTPCEIHSHCLSTRGSTTSQWRAPGVWNRIDVFTYCAGPWLYIFFNGWPVATYSSIISRVLASVAIRFANRSPSSSTASAMDRP